jgi:hypothetical protein
MTAKNDHTHIIEKILHSKSLADSEKSRQLLIYLYKEAQQNRIPKEIDVAIDIFQRPSFNPAEDTIVRVALHKLRQKLSLYYNTEGKRDKLRIAIPKGSYQLIVEKQDRLTIKKKQALLLLNFVLFAIIVFLCGFLYYDSTSDQARLERWNIIPEENPIWADIFASKKPLVLAIGDIYLLKDVSGDIALGSVFRGPVNSDWDFNRFMQEHPDYDGKIEAFNDYHFLPEYSYTGLADLLPSLFYYDVDVTIQPASELTAEQFANNNIIFIGYYKTAIPFHNVLSELEFQIDLIQEEISGLDSSVVPGGVARPAADPKKHHSDISYAAKLPGPNGNTFFLFMGFRLAGVQDVVKQFSTRTRLENVEYALKTKSNSTPSYFQVVNQVEGFGREEIRSEILGIYVHAPTNSE